jgi:hypothetical protein
MSDLSSTEEETSSYVSLKRVGEDADETWSLDSKGANDFFSSPIVISLVNLFHKAMEKRTYL